MKHYLLSIQQPDGPPPESAVFETIARETKAVDDEMRAVGAWVFSDPLHAASTATVLRPTGDEVLVTDGPYTEGKEHVGGVVIIRATDLDCALSWGRKVARATTLPVEVRPFVTEA